VEKPLSIGESSRKDPSQKGGFGKGGKKHSEDLFQGNEFFLKTKKLPQRNKNMRRRVKGLKIEKTVSNENVDRLH